MGRSVVLAGAARCPGCSLPPRWCTCHALPPVETRLAVHVLIHRGETRKPSSTGALVVRTVTGAVSHVYQRPTRFHAARGVSAELAQSKGDLWILHPGGEPLDVAHGESGDPPADRRRVLLLDGTWRQAREMLRTVEGLGRCVRLPDAGDAPGRYWLRDQPAAMHLSTAEALAGVLRSVGEREAERRLRLHFELHVYATLLSRGRREMAERYLGLSPLLTDAPQVVDRLHAQARTASDSPAA